MNEISSLILGLLIFFLFMTCKKRENDQTDLQIDRITKPAVPDLLTIPQRHDPSLSLNLAKGPLLLTHFDSFDQFQKFVQITYFRPGENIPFYKKPYVKIVQGARGKGQTSILKTGVSENDFIKVKNGGWLDRLWLMISSPYAVINRMNLRAAFALSRRKDKVFGESDVAFYDLAEIFTENISTDEKANMSEADLGEKGYINTFNHLIAQAIMTSIYSENFADFVADSHERRHIPELISGAFTENQRRDIQNGATDNYLDMINNEWGQELGKELKKIYNIDKDLKWSPDLLTNYLNDIQSYCSWAFGISFNAVNEKDFRIIKFSQKINRVLDYAPLF